METGKSATFPLPPSLKCSGGHHSFLHFPDSTSPGLTAFPIDWSRPHTANQNKEGLYPNDDETGLGDSQFLIFIYILIQGFIVEIYCTFYEETHEDRNIARMLVEEYI